MGAISNLQVVSLPGGKVLSDVASVVRSLVPLPAVNAIMRPRQPCDVDVQSPANENAKLRAMLTTCIGCLGKAMESTTSRGRAPRVVSVTASKLYALHDGAIADALMDVQNENAE
jgi:hypothetical protein